MKLSTKAAVFKRASLLVGGPSMSIGEARPILPSSPPLGAGPAHPGKIHEYFLGLLLSKFCFGSGKFNFLDVWVNLPFIAHPGKIRGHFLGLAFLSASSQIFVGDCTPSAANFSVVTLSEQTRTKCLNMFCFYCALDLNIAIFSFVWLEACPRLPLSFKTTLQKKFVTYCSFLQQRVKIFKCLDISTVRNFIIFIIRKVDTGNVVVDYNL